MKNFLGVLFVIAVVCFSCDGRQTKKESLQKAVSEFNLKAVPIPTITHSPEAYTEIVTDTLIANIVKVHIKNYTLKDAQILVPTSVPGRQHYQRVFESEILITTATKNILHTHISAQHFRAIDSDPFWDHATLQHTWVNQELSSLEDITLDISFMNPLTSAFKLYRMSINAQGQQTLTRIEERS
ncbi:hypothetical protein ES711_13350 [Gelidibacter salicanalis]|uniref:DUF4738 domain-containing protein n=1 Tax=Gelidibacter salicanalis TaxID=291193 RepID=A0A5C7AIT3_9FLAO|nr:hypothetical protein [Gelidibacter salicanalis]TXE06495.1 hypothetical protein ES711_13350 [Gelidibacter salicanalis]